MFYYILSICSSYNGTVTCLPPVYLNTQTACIRLGDAYRLTGANTSARCTQIRKQDVR